MLYGARGCQLLSACKAAGAPFDVVLACDPSANARTLLRTHSQCLCVVEDLGKLARAVASNVKFNVIGYTMHVPLDEDRFFNANFWEYQGRPLIEDCRPPQAWPTHSPGTCGACVPTGLGGTLLQGIDCPSMGSQVSRVDVRDVRRHRIRCCGVLVLYARLCGRVMIPGT